MYPIMSTTPLTLASRVRNLPAWLMAGLAAVCLTLVLALPHTAHAATCTFASVGTSDFNTSANWSCGHSPTTTDDVIIPASTSTSMSATTTIQSLSIGSSSTLNPVSFELNVTGSTTNSGTINNPVVLGDDGFFGSGLNFATTTNNGSIGNGQNGGIKFSGTIRNLGTLNTTDKIFFYSQWNNTGGTVLGSPTLSFVGVENQTFPANVSPIRGLEITKSNNASVILSSNVTVTSTVNFWTGSTLDLSSFTLSVQGAWGGIGSGIITGGGAVQFSGAASRVVTQNQFTNLVIDSAATVELQQDTAVNGTLGLQGHLQFNAGSHALNVAATSTIGGVLGPLFANSINFQGAVNSSGTIQGGGSTLTFFKSFISSGTFTPATSTVVFAATSTQNIPAITYNNVTVSGSGPINLTASTTAAGNVTISSGGVFAQTGGNVLYVGGNWSDSGTYNGSNGETQFFGPAAQSLGAEPNFYDLTFNKSTGTVTLAGAVSASDMIVITSGTVDLNGNTLSDGGTWSDSGTLTGTGTVRMNGVGAQSIFVEPHFYDLVIANPGNIVDLGGDVTSTHSLTISTGSTLDVSGQTLSVPGTMSNSGLITLNGGKIVHPTESYTFTDVNGGAITTYAHGDHVYLTLQDANRNLNGASIETVTTTASTANGDTETFTLTETAAASGIFRDVTAPYLVVQPVASSGNGTLEAFVAGNLTSNYTDNQDASDSATTTKAFTATAAPVSSGGGGGGGGLSAGTSLPINPTQQSHTNDLQNLQNMGIAIHSLVKLPDDRNANTQADSAVYYIGTDGMRHAFSNDKVYFTWYTNFNGVQIVNQTQLASIPLGKNVTYKPGVKMVKFTTNNSVYAVAKGGVLRKIGSEALAISLYGSNWNHMIDDISDAFYTNYTMGLDINAASDYDPAAAKASVTYPSDSLQP